MVARRIDDRFEILRFLARGGMGEVYLALDLDTAQPAVLKLARDDVADDEGRFEHEIAVTRRVRHPLVPRQLAEGTWEERRFVAFEFIDGPSIADLLAGLRRRLPVGLAALLAIDVLDALQAVHAAGADDGVALGLVHRDVSPQNLLVDRSGRCHLIDFGISTDRAFSVPLGLVMGKPGYLAPEQLAGIDVDGATDQFALGVVLWEMLTGIRLSSDDVVAGTVQAPPAGTLVTEVPPAMDAVITRLLARDRGARFASCTAAARALRSASTHIAAEERRYDLQAMLAESERVRSPPTVVERARTQVSTELSLTAR